MVRVDTDTRAEATRHAEAQGQPEPVQSEAGQQEGGPAAFVGTD